MALPMMELEGTWEEILAHADELAGRRVRLTVLPGEREAGDDQPRLSPANQQMLDLLDEMEANPLTGEEQAILDDLGEHLKRHPFSLRQVEAEP